MKARESSLGIGLLIRIRITIIIGLSWITLRIALGYYITKITRGLTKDYYKHHLGLL